MNMVLNVGVKNSKTTNKTVKPIWQKRVLSKADAFWLASGYRFARCGVDGAVMEPHHVPAAYRSVFEAGIAWFNSVKGAVKAAATRWVMEYTR